jgi:hypothetical protein
LIALANRFVGVDGLFKKDNRQLWLVLGLIQVANVAQGAGFGGAIAASPP